MIGATAQKVALAAGGTGGHLFPAQALARELKARGISSLLLTDRRGSGYDPASSSDSDVTDSDFIEQHAIAAGGVAGSGPVKRAKSLAQLSIGYLQARKILRQCGATAVVGFGGYPSVPSALAGSHLGLPLVLHEQNAVLGRANRFLARRAQVICTSFAKVSAFADNDLQKVVLTGNPVRDQIARIGDAAYPHPNPNDLIEILVVGGSQGATIFNDVVPAAIASLPEELRHRLKVTQQVPGNMVERIAGGYDACDVAHQLAAFFHDLPRHLYQAHLVIGRAGASTVAELAMAGRPAILVPYPSATDDHQTANAQALTEVGGGWLIPQSALTVESLAERLLSLLTTPALLSKAADGARGAAHPRAAGHLADVICRLFEENGDTNPQEVAA
ncbi:MAG: undecaprenyldiphospho-muramoylpentapeptide beta-N-acetylglucosaminyltransferase [Pseudomonadota bacterium]